MTGLDAALVFLVVLWLVVGALATAEAMWARADRKATETATEAAHEDGVWFDVDDIDWRSAA